MARDDSEKFRVRPGRSRNRGPRINPRTQPFLKQVQIAVRKAGGDPRRIGSDARSGGGREEEGRAASTRAAGARKSLPRSLARAGRVGGREIPQAASGRGAWWSKQGWSGSIRKLR